MKRRNINVKEQIRGFFFMNPTAKVRVRQLERKLNLPLPSIIRYCKELKDEGIIKPLVNENVVFYSADRANKVFLLEKKIFNLRQIYYSGLIEYLIHDLSNPTVFLFGSYSKGEDTEESDVDLYIETPSKEEIDVSKFEESIRRKIQIFKFKSIKSVGNIHLANNIINGISLNGYIEVFK